MFLAASSRRLATGISALLLAALTAVVYTPYLANPLVFDDLNVFNGINIYDFATDIWRTQVRWVSYATLAHTYMLSDGNIFVLRFGNLLLHAATAFAVFVLLRDLLGAAGEGGAKAVDDPARAARLALMGAALFAVHPVAVYGAGYLIQRTIEMSTLFMLLMLIAYLRWLNDGRRVMWVISAFCYLLSVFSKEHSIAAPAVALLLTLVLRRPSLDLARRLAPPFIVYAVIAVVIILVAKGVLGTNFEPDVTEMLGEERAELRSYPLSVITQAGLFFKYLFLWLVPNPAWMSMDMREPVAESLSLPYVAAAVAFASYAWIAIRMVMKGGMAGVVGWLMAFPCLMFMTEFSTVRGLEPFVLYRSYLWLPLFGVFLPLALERSGPRLAVSAVAVLVCVFVPLSWNRLASLSDPLVAWNDAAKLLKRGDEPGAGRIYYNRALALSEKRRPKDALADIDRVVALHPRFAPGHFARAKLLFDLKRPADALEEINIAIGINPRQSSYYSARSVALKSLGRDEDALQDLFKSCDMGNIVACSAVGRRSRAVK